MGTIFAVVGSNLTVAYFEVKMFALLPQIYPRDFVDVSVFFQLGKKWHFEISKNWFFGNKISIY